nr:helix-turn-helix transcriptional regulator [Lactobacillus johnsonii]
MRKEKGLTLKQMGQLLNMLDSTLSQYENGRRRPKEETWKKLADFFDASVPYLQGATTYEVLDPLEKGIYDHVTVAMDRAFNEYALLPETREKILKTIAYSIENGEFN